MNLFNERNCYIMQFRFSEQDYPLLLDINTLIYNIILSHDFGVILTEEEYVDYRFNQFFWRRNGRSIKPYHRIHTSKIIKESPLFLEIILGSIGGIWGLLQIIEKVQNWPLKKEKLKLEVEKLKDEKIVRHKNLELSAEYREASDIMNRLVKHFENSSLVLEDVTLKMIKRDND